VKKFHAFWMNGIGNIPEYASFDDEKPVLDLVKKAKEEDSSIYGLRVIYGEYLEFEPVKIVDSWKIKQPK